MHILYDINLCTYKYIQHDSTHATNYHWVNTSEYSPSEDKCRDRLTSTKQTEIQIIYIHFADQQQMYYCSILCICTRHVQGQSWQQASLPLLPSSYNQHTILNK